ncbi:hypothetical protein HPP92_023444 [Vanilla planifolia]|uniref:STICHEL DnaA-N-like alpha-beta domain-containing protein n=1 Tax=Vanilla planifolia TaxID=51239 RepID=A0A835PTD6_VANPL|nr:hypothetical protein HPP92_023735 [Vanilla planifolia]KAG0460316.1 hypothetical protein HPP92_023444 [Vanilla planifolia]
MHVGGKKPNATASWDGTTSSFEGDEFDHLDLPVRQGCRLPCYWSKRTKDRCFKGLNSPSLSDSVGKEGGSTCCRSQTMHRRKKSTGFDKTCYLPKCSQDFALLVNKSHVTSSDEISTNFGELDLEALSRLDGRRWSSSKSQEVFELDDDREAAFNIAYKKCLSTKYKPRTFDEIIGQNIVVQSLVSDIVRGRIASGYIFYGPHGAGKTSTARIFAAALNCLSTEGNKPCYLCKECTLFCEESELFMREVSAINKKCIDRVINLLKNMNTLKMSRYKIFIINECHLLTSKMWSAFMRVLEETNSNVVIIFITIDHENVPCAITSCCQKYLFSKIKDADVICRLEKISAAENLDVDMEALNLIAANSAGSLEDAETMLYELSLLGKRITSSLVNDLVVVISDEKLLELVEIAMSSNNEEIAERSKSLVNSGVDPIALMSQLAGLIMDIIAGTHQLSESQFDNQDFGGRSLTEDELKRLQEALKILSDAVKRLKHSSEHSSMLTSAQYLSLLTSALLQLSSDQNVESTQPNSNKVHAADKMNDITKSCSAVYNKSDNLISTHISSQKSSTRLSSHNSNSNAVSIKSQSVNHTLSNNVHLDSNANGIPWDLFEIWSSCIQKCYSRTLRQLLSLHGKLISVTENEGILIAFIAFADRCVKLRAERYLSSITNSLEKILKCNVEVRLGLIMDDKWISLVPPPESLVSQKVEKIGSLRNQKRIVPDGMKGLPTKTSCILSHPQKIRNASEDTVHKK